MSVYTCVEMKPVPAELEDFNPSIASISLGTFHCDWIKETELPVFVDINFANHQK